MKTISGEAKCPECEAVFTVTVMFPPTFIEVMYEWCRMCTTMQRVERGTEGACDECPLHAVEQEYGMSCLRVLGEGHHDRCQAVVMAWAEQNPEEAVEQNVQ